MKLSVWVDMKLSARVDMKLRAWVDMKRSRTVAPLINDSYMPTKAKHPLIRITLRYYSHDSDIISDDLSVS